MNIKPLGNIVLLEVLEAQDKTEGGFILPDAVKEIPQEMKVIAIGDKVTKVKVDDVVLTRNEWDKRVKVEGKDVLLIKEEHVIAIVT